MFKKLFFIAAATFMLAACAKTEEDIVNPYEGMVSTKITLGASFELGDATKSDIDENGNFTWSTGDAIKVYSNTEHWSTLNILANEVDRGPKYSLANFSGTMQGDYITTAAVFPKTVTPAIDGETLSLTLPATIAWNDASLDDLEVSTMQADNIMVARGFEDGASSVNFYNVGGLFRLTLNNVPAGANRLVFTADKKVNGTFTVGTVTESNVEYPCIETSETYSEGENIINIDFATVETPKKMVFFIPVPVGEYRIGFAVQSYEKVNNVETATTLWEFSSSKGNSVARSHCIKMPTLTYVTVGGEGEGATNIIVTPTSYSGTVNLPSTNSNVYVRMNETDGTITLEYSQAANALHPANVYLQALGNINTIEVNLPDSHVELTGEDDVLNVITNVSAFTSISTFVVDDKVQIGKEDAVDSGLTITGGSLDLDANVKGTVKVIYAPAVETVNQTTEKVSINIKKEIKELVVTSASTQSAPDKIYVTLGAESKVTEKLQVPEVNCNLYVAPGAQATVVETSAAENTIEGTIESIVASGENTTVTITENAEFANSTNCSIEASEGATIFVSESVDLTNVETENNSGNNGVDEGYIINVSDEAVAAIGTTTYTTLSEAFNEVGNNQTVKLLSDVNLGEAKLILDLEGKTVTLDLAGKTLTGRTNLTSGNLTIQNGNVVNTDGQPLNVYGSDIQGAQNYSVLSVARDVTVTGEYGVCVFGAPAGKNGYGAVVNVEGKLIANNGIFVSGNLGNNVAADMNNIVNISGTLTSESDVAVALNGWATVNIQSGAKITGNTGIAVKRGVLNVYDGATVTANGQWVTPPAANNSGTEPTGAAVSMTNTYNNYGAMAVNIAGGSFTSVNGQALYKADQTYANAATFTVTGGTFSSDPTDYLAAGYTTSGNNPWTVIKREGAVTNLAELQEAISNHITPIYYIGEAITEAFTLTPSVATTIHGLKVNHQTVASNATTLTINGDITLNDANIISKAYCAVSVAAEKTVTLKDCVVDGSTAAASDSRAMNINGGATVTIDGSTVKGPATAGYSRCINVLDDGAHVDIINGSVLSVSHYAINLPSSTVNAVINVNNSSVNTGWAITNIWKTGNTINLTNCTLNSVNDKTQAPDNNFSAFVFNNKDNNISSDNVVTVNNCAVNVSSTTGNRQSLISMRGNNDTIKFIGSDGTIALAENGGLSYQFGQLHSSLNNTLFFDEANYNQIDDYLDESCAVTTVNNLYKVTYVTEVFYYWYTTDNNTDGAYCKLAEPFESSAYIMSDGEFIRLQKNIELSANITVSLSNYLHAGNYFTMIFGDYNITKGEYSIILPAGLSVKTDKQTDVFTGANGAMIVETVSSNEYTYTAVQSVAQIGTTPYATLEAAFAAANAMETEATITLLSDVTITENNIVVGGTHGATAKVTATVSPVNITFDLNNHNITGTKTIYLVGGSLNITGTGTIETTDEDVAAVGVRYVKSTGGLDYTSRRTLTIGQNVTLKGAKYGLNVFGTNEGTVANNIEVNVNGTIKGDLFVLGNLTNQYNTIDINVNGTIDASAVDMNGIALNGYANVTVGANAVVKGNTGIEVRAGRLVVNGGEITATSEFSITSNGSGTSTKGAAVAVSQHTTNLPCSAIISGGTFTGAYALYEKDVEIAPSDNITLSVTDGTFNGNIYSEDFTHFISGGTFNVDPSYFVADSHGAVFTTGGKYLVTNSNWADAAASNADFEAATDGTTINISSAALLAKFAKNVNEGVSNYEGYTVNITANIDLSGKVWTPIGLESYGRRFKGTFNGNGNNYTISNMSVKDVKNSGLFGTLHGGTIQNVKIDNFIVVSHHYAGPVLAWGESSAIKNIIDRCVVSNGTVITTPHVVDNKWDDGDKAGGLCGWVAVNNVEVTNNSVSNVKITAYRDLGGLLGYAKTAFVTNNTVQNVTVKQSNVHAYLESVSTYGELIGRIEGENTIENNTTSSVTVSHD